MAIWKNIANKVILENWSDLANHLYYLIIDIKKLYLKIRK